MVVAWDELEKRSRDRVAVVFTYTACLYLSGVAGYRGVITEVAMGHCPGEGVRKSGLHRRERKVTLVFEYWILMRNGNVERLKMCVGSWKPHLTVFTLVG
jgi:hypothetical protein